MSMVCSGAQSLKLFEPGAMKLNYRSETYIHTAGDMVDKYRQTNFELSYARMDCVYL